ncbi:MAG: 3-deoxy-D-manno-octulosonic acid transferase [Bacteroidales bacterium]|nr:3-deoxy-D-manno-octulosonic acid transferase [Bacteroidales bacterium]
MRLFYNLFLHLYHFAITLASPFYEKARLWKKGRKNIMPRLTEACKGQKVIWLHCASLGEYEQGKPLIEKWRKEKPDYHILVTFFSPSGYEVRKNDKTADSVFYLPFDTIKNVNQFLDIVRPTAAVFVKYEYWFNYMDQLRKRSIPFYYVSAIFHENQHFFRWYGGWFRKQLAKATHFYVQDENSANLLHSIGIHKVTVAGDTRFDRVHRIATENIPVPEIEEFKGSSKLLIAGSTWAPDEEILAGLLPQICNEYKLVIAPHLVDNDHIKAIENLFSSKKVVRFSQKDGHNLSDFDVFIIDTIGLLNKMYKYGDVAYVGGAFETGLHNTLEPAVFGIPIFFGPHYSKFNEAIALVHRKAAFSIKSLEELKEIWQQSVSNLPIYEQTCQNCKQYVMENLGAVEKIEIKVKE